MEYDGIKERERNMMLHNMQIGCLRVYRFFFFLPPLVVVVKFVGAALTDDATGDGTRATEGITVGSMSARGVVGRLGELYPTKVDSQSS